MENSNDIKTVDEDLISPEVRTIEYITVSDVDDVRLNSLIHVPTALLSDDVPLKLAVLKSLARERLVDEARKTQVIEKMAEDLYTTKNNLKDCRKELNNTRSLREEQYRRMDTKFAKTEIALAESESTIELLQLRNNHLEGLINNKGISNSEPKPDAPEVFAKKRSWFSRTFW